MFAEPLLLPLFNEYTLEPFGEWRGQNQVGQP